MNNSRHNKLAFFIVVMIITGLSCNFPSSNSEELAAATDTPDLAAASIPTGTQIIPTDTTAPASKCLPSTVGYWNFDQMEGTILTEMCETGNDGVIHGDAAWVEMDQRMGLQFDGIDDYVEIPNQAPFSLDTYTIEIILRIDSYPTDDQWILFKGFFYGNYTVMIYANSEAYSYLNQNQDGGNFSMGSKNSLPLNEFVHIAIVRGTEAVTLYINGEEVSSYSSPPEAALWEEPVVFGAGGYKEIEKYFTGIIDEVRISNEALDPSNFLVVSE